MKSAETYVIAGGSAAAVAAVEGIRSLDPGGRIVLVARERGELYSRPLLPDLVAGKRDASGMGLRPPGFLARHRVEARLGAEIEKVDPDGRALLLAGGERLAFGKLLLATGGAPVIPEVEGRDLAGVFSFTTREDAEAVGAFLAARPVRRAAVVGGGMIGLKAAEALVARGLACTVVELAPRVLPQALDEAAARLAAQALWRAGVELLCGEAAARIRGSRGAVCGLELRSGAALDCELVILAVGVCPDVRIVQGTAVRTDLGVLVNERMETNVPGVYAAGDAAQGREALTGRSRPVPIFPNAARQGRAAGRNMAGSGEACPESLTMNAVSVFGLPMVSVGQVAPPPGPEGEELVASRECPPAYRKVVLRGGRVVGALFAGDIERAGIFTGLIRGGIDVSAVRDLLLTEDFGVLSLPADYRKHVVSGAGIEV